MEIPLSLLNRFAARFREEEETTFGLIDKQQLVVSLF